MTNNPFDSQHEALEHAKQAVQAHHRSEALRFTLLAEYSRHNAAIGETVALERMAAKHRLLALS